MKASSRNWDNYISDMIFDFETCSCRPQLGNTTDLLLTSMVSASSNASNIERNESCYTVTAHVCYQLTKHVSS
jgi:hypothetical protein